MAWAELRANGRFSGVYRIPDGRKRRTHETFSSKRQARNVASALEAQAAEPGWRDPSSSARTWGEWEPLWAAARGAGPATVRHEASMLNKHIRPRWGEVPLDQITRHDVKEWAESMRAGGLANASVDRIVAVFRHSLSAAVDKEILFRNPAFSLGLDHSRPDIIRFLTRDEVSAIHEQLRGDDLEVSRFLLGTGLRFSEMNGLRVMRVAPAYRKIRVSEAWSGSTRQLLPHTKAKNIREVPVPPDLRDEVLAPRVRGRGREDFVFARNDRPLDHNNWRNRVWNPAVERAGIGHARPHDLRHTYASWLLQGGVPLAHVQVLLGHMDQATTQRYAAFVGGEDESIFEALRG